MNAVIDRENSVYGIRNSKNFELALSMLKSYKKDETKSLGPCLEESFGEPPVFACRSCRVANYKHLLALANEDGKIGIRDVTSLRTNSGPNLKYIQGHLNAIFDLSWSDSCLRLASASGDHTAVLWDVSDQAITAIGMCEGHTRSVKVVSFRPQSSNVFATGARDGVVMVWDYRNPHQNAAVVKPDNMILNAHCQSGGSSVKKAKRVVQPSRAESITGLVFQDENFLISCSAGDGLIKVWDIRKCYSIYHSKLPIACYSLPHPGDSAKQGFTSLSVDPAGVRLFANCMDSSIYCYNIATYDKTPVAKYSGHQNSTFYVKSCLSGDGQYLLSGSSDEKAYIWRVRQPGSPLVRLVGHTAEVTCVEWVDSFDGDLKLVTCADDATHRLWSVSPPTDDNNSLHPELIGWTEWVDKYSCVITTPGSVKRLARRQDFTPRYSDMKWFKTTEEDKSSERMVLSSVQPRMEGKGARRLFDCDSSSACNGVDALSPTSNLPNYVVEGTSPFHRCSSTANKQKENWLAKLQKTPSPKQILKKITPKRRSQSQTEKLPSSKACGNLLQFFKKTGKQTPVNENSCDVQKDSFLQNTPSIIK